MAGWSEVQVITWWDSGLVPEVGGGGLVEMSP